MPNPTNVEIIEWTGAAELRQTLEEQSNPHTDEIHALAVAARAKMVGHGILNGFMALYEKAETGEDCLAYSEQIGRTRNLLARITESSEAILSNRENEVEKPEDKPISDELIIVVAHDIYPKSSGLGVKTVNKLRRGYEMYTFASDALATEPTDFERTRWMYYKDIYGTYGGLYIEPGQLSLNRLAEMLSQNTITDLYDVGEASGSLIETFIRSVAQDK